jgi:hypothetical protein
MGASSCLFLILPTWPKGSHAGNWEFIFSIFIFILTFSPAQLTLMRKIVFTLIGLGWLLSAGAQRKAYDQLDLFEKEDILELAIKTDLKDFLGKKPNDRLLYSSFSMKNGDSVVAGEVNIRARGKFRRQNCYVPPIKLDFDTSSNPTLQKLGSIDLTIQCKQGKSYEQYIFKEYTVYKIYNVLTDKSQHVRLANVTLEDKEGKRKPVMFPAFLIEDFDVTAKRNDCKEVKIQKLHTENTDRKQMTMVAMFEYMIGNTDWSIPANHNIKLMQDTLGSQPFAVAYDFDYSGLVNTEYAIPSELLGTTSVTERVYRGFPREISELKEMADIFRAKQADIYAVINNSPHLNDGSKKEMIRYLDGFYKDIADEKKLKVLFIDNARMN